MSDQDQLWDKETSGIFNDPGNTSKIPLIYIVEEVSKCTISSKKCYYICILPSREDLNGHVGEGNGGDEEVMGKYGVGETLKEFGDCKVVPGESVAKQHRVLIGRRKEDKETWWWNEEVQESISKKKRAKMKWDRQMDEESKQEYKEMQSTAKKEVAKAKDRAYEKLYEKLDSREGEKDLYRLARQRDRAGRDVQHVKMIKDVDGNILTSEESVLRRWKEYFEELMNIENVRERRLEELEEWNEEVQEISRDEVRKAMKMKAGKAVGPDSIPVEAWRSLGTKLY
ncbi:hypothetical protein Pmani_028704 [Petrolisthes manimaculis]|uniref:Uncharacterized protein n=1 Tax=Petrolisthes manimaculis TaxID=1843537 RepID=A0AAE1TV86_9EUCA|nr:hypothetical protein Pmani_028704 [Petrolisthes manimaculis]